MAMPSSPGPNQRSGGSSTIGSWPTASSNIMNWSMRRSGFLKLDGQRSEKRKWREAEMKSLWRTRRTANVRHQVFSMSITMSKRRPSRGGSQENIWLLRRHSPTFSVPCQGTMQLVRGNRSPPQEIADYFTEGEGEKGECHRREHHTAVVVP
jgi:hypothetical protein